MLFRLCLTHHTCYLASLSRACSRVAQNRLTPVSGGRAGRLATRGQRTPRRGSRTCPRRAVRRTCALGSVPNRLWGSRNGGSGGKKTKRAPEKKNEKKRRRKRLQTGERRQEFYEIENKQSQSGSSLALPLPLPLARAQL